MARDTKERLLAAALELFSQNGYAGTNVRELILLPEFKETLNKCVFGVRRVFFAGSSPEKLEIHKVFLCFPGFDPTKNPSPFSLAD